MKEHGSVVIGVMITLHLFDMSTCTCKEAEKKKKRKERDKSLTSLALEH